MAAAGLAGGFLSQADQLGYRLIVVPDGRAFHLYLYNTRTIWPAIQHVFMDQLVYTASSLCPAVGLFVHKPCFYTYANAIYHRPGKCMASASLHDQGLHFTFNPPTPARSSGNSVADRLPTQMASLPLSIKAFISLQVHPPAPAPSTPRSFAPSTPRSFLRQLGGGPPAHSDGDQLGGRQTGVGPGRVLVSE